MQRKTLLSTDAMPPLTACIAYSIIMDSWGGLDGAGRMSMVDVLFVLRLFDRILNGGKSSWGLRGLRIGRRGLRLLKKGMEWLLWTIDWPEGRNEDAVQEDSRRPG